jgi:uncharacterized protein YebE (UPF0316 family)
MTLFLGGLFVFCLRVCDVSIGTLRMLYAVRGRRFTAAALGLVESSVFIVAISRVMKEVGNWATMAGYACGFSGGIIVGITIERWIGSGWVLARIISRTKSKELLAALCAADFGVTALEGKGRELEVMVLLVVVRRRRGRQMLELVNEIDPEAFVTTESVQIASGGYLPMLPGGASVRK